ncbi:MAG: HesA/MoeB/ThiF family protein, partial [Bacteroidota bacterium]
MNRYARQTVLPEVGQEGQEKLKTTSVLCVGAGGLGSPALLYLAAAGIGRIGLVDDDITDISNLQRQVLFREENQGAPKVKAAAVALASLNSECSIEPHHERLTAINAERLVTGYDIIIDGTDNFGSKFLINDACVKYGKPLVYGSILGFEAQVSLFWAVHGPCYRCLYSKPPSNHIPNCAEAGVIGAIAGIAGTVQALEAIKIALGLTWCKEKNLEPLLGKLWMLDARSMETKTLKLHKRNQCPVCTCDPDDIVLED